MNKWHLLREKFELRSWRLPALLFAVIMLPAVVFTSVLLAWDAQMTRIRVEDSASNRASEIVARMDIDAKRSITALQLLATSRQMTSANWALGRSRAVDVMALNPDWVAVSLFDSLTDRPIFSTHLNPKKMDLRKWDVLPPDSRPLVGGIARRTGYCTCMLLAQRLQGHDQHLVLVAEIDPSRIQALLVEKTPGDVTSAIVDTKGNFIARTKNIETRLGTPATKYVRAAIKGGTEGFYQGTTYEGMKNYTAFVTSDLTGWSVHLALSSALVTKPEGTVWFSIVLATFATVSFAAFAAWFAWHTHRAQELADSRLHAAERMDSLGQLTGGIAHDFNNMLAVISGNIELAIRHAHKGGDVTRFLDAALDGARRSKDLTARMLAFAKKQDLSAGPVDICRLVSSTVNLLDRTIGEHIKVQVMVPEALPCAMVDASHLENALINLAANARDAMPNGGSIVMSASVAGKGMPIGNILLDKEMVLLSVSDEGCGMPANVLKRAVEPFFTTKGPGGTGLGLSQIAGFVQQSGGFMNIESTEGIGTRVDLLLPISNEAAPSVVSDRTARIEARKLKVLLVEDDVRVRETTTAALREIGHHVSAVENSEQALQKLDSEQVDLLISDILMPGMNGRELAHLVRKRFPSIPILLISAYAPESQDDIFDRLSKPFSLDDLQEALTKIMTRSASSRGTKSR